MAHIHEKIDFTTVAYIVNADKVLMIFHKALQRWLPVGGHIELDEDPIQALIREVEEETGIESSHLQVSTQKPAFDDPIYNPLFPPNFLDTHEITPQHRHVGMIYVLRSHTNQVLLAEREHEQIRWLSEQDISDPANNLMTGTQYYAAQALKLARDSHTHWEPLA